MKRTFIVIFILAALLSTSCNSNYSRSIPDEVVQLAEEYLDALINSTSKPIDIVYFKPEHDTEKEDYLNQGYPLLSYKIEDIEEINKDLYCLTILYELSTTSGNYIKAYNFIGVIDGEYKFIINQRDIPENIKENFESEKYIYFEDEILCS